MLPTMTYTAVCKLMFNRLIRKRAIFRVLGREMSHQSMPNLPLFSHFNKFLTAPPKQAAEQKFPRWPADPSLCEFGHEENPQYVLIVLNGPITAKERFRSLYERASLVVCADGGSNRLYDWAKDEREAYKPDLILGDLDSIRPEVREFYERRGDGTPGSIVEKLYDQDYNDFEKSLMFLQEKQPCPLERLVVVAYGAFGGRFDQEMASMNVLQKFSAKCKRLLLLGDINLAELLLPGYRHEIHTNLECEGDSVGLIPVGEPAESVHTSGLKWNLAGDGLKFGGLISTSNTFAETAESTDGAEPSKACPPVVTVTTSHPLVWVTARDHTGRD